MYEVLWMTYETVSANGIKEQCFTTEQANTLEDAMAIYNKAKSNIDVEHVKISVILDEYNRG